MPRIEGGLRWAALMVLAGGLPSCSDAAPSFDHLEYRDVSSSSSDAFLGSREIRLTVGIAVEARVSAIGDDGRPLDMLELASVDEQTLGVARGPKLGTYVFFGVHEGETEIRVSSRGDEMGTVPASVLRAE